LVLLTIPIFNLESFNLKVLEKSRGRSYYHLVFTLNWTTIEVRMYNKSKDKIKNNGYLKKAVAIITCKLVDLKYT
jgi:hypothetical protein